MLVDITGVPERDPSILMTEAIPEAFMTFLKTTRQFDEEADFDHLAVAREFGNYLAGCLIGGAVDKVTEGNVLKALQNLIEHISNEIGVRELCEDDSDESHE
ncbi:Protein of unknown function [Pyronema omphalodes CBS 100304]|uniref:Uncharacterized protein n=1 Tax=Pyronema omphalodes (strain CBS 100304) TaxID=1076935 RepID=U4L3U8_PYROM|nr:Protein of unknown function [Pyronema omphalodes CBS 100304]